MFNQQKKIIKGGDVFEGDIFEFKTTVIPSLILLILISFLVFIMFAINDQ